MINFKNRFSFYGSKANTALHKSTDLHELRFLAIFAFLKSRIVSMRQGELLGRQKTLERQVRAGNVFMKRCTRICKIIFTIWIGLIASKSHTSESSCKNDIGEVGHLSCGVSYGQNNVKVYSEQLHGIDGAALLDPYFIPFLQNSKGQVMLDAGCGSGIWSAIAAQHGAKVYACDLQPEFAKKVYQVIDKMEVVNSVFFSLEDVSWLPYRDKLFDKSFSLLVVCNLPNEALDLHIKELSRVTKHNGEVLIVAPNSLDNVFSSSVQNFEQLKHQIKKAINTLPSNPTSNQISQALLPLKHILSATFALNSQERLFLVEDTKFLQAGQTIWRKVHSITIPNFFHSLDEYCLALTSYGFEITKILEPKFNSIEDLDEYNQSDNKLGPSYVSHAPFVLIFARKK